MKSVLWRSAGDWNKCISVAGDDVEKSQNVVYVSGA